MFPPPYFYDKSHSKLSKNDAVCMSKEAWCVGLGHVAGYLLEGWRNCLKYLKREWNRKEGKGNKVFEKCEQSGSRGGCLKKWVWAGSPLKTMLKMACCRKRENLDFDWFKNITRFYFYFIINITKCIFKLISRKQSSKEPFLEIIHCLLWIEWCLCYCQESMIFNPILEVWNLSYCI